MNVLASPLISTLTSMRNCKYTDDGTSVYLEMYF